MSQWRSAWCLIAISFLIKNPIVIAYTGTRCSGVTSRLRRPFLYFLTYGFLQARPGRPLVAMVVFCTLRFLIFGGSNGTSGAPFGLDFGLRGAMLIRTG